MKMLMIVLLSVISIQSWATEVLTPTVIPAEDGSYVVYNYYGNNSDAPIVIPPITVDGKNLSLSKNDKNKIIDLIVLNGASDPVIIEDYKVVINNLFLLDIQEYESIYAISLISGEWNVVESLTPSVDVFSYKITFILSLIFGFFMLCRWTCRLITTNNPKLMLIYYINILAFILVPVDFGWINIFIAMYLCMLSRYWLQLVPFLLFATVIKSIEIFNSALLWQLFIIILLIEIMAYKFSIFLIMNHKNIQSLKN